MNDSEEPELIFEQRGKNRDVHHKRYYQELVKRSRNVNINYDSSVSEDSKRALTSLKIAVRNALNEKKLRGQYSVVWDKNSSHPKQLNYVSESGEDYQV